MQVKFNLSDEDINKISEEAEAYKREYKERGMFQPGVPICFLGDGTYVFRIYPDRDAHGFIRLIKRVWIHGKVRIDDDKFRWFWKDERVDKLFGEAKEAGMEKMWGKFLYQYTSREQGYMMAHFYESADEQWTKKGQPYAVILDRRQMFAIQDFITELHPDDKRQILNPNNPAPGIKLSITRGGGKANVSCGIAGMTKFELPDLQFKDEDGNPIEYKGLDHVYITEKDKLADEDFFMLRNGVYQEIANFKALGGGAKDRSSEGHKLGQNEKTPSAEVAGSGFATQQTTQANSVVSAATPAAQSGEKQCRLADQTKINPKMAEAYPDARFGNKPNKSTPYCLACSFEEDCTIETQKSKAA